MTRCFICGDHEDTINLIGKQVRVEADTVRIEGELQDLGVLTETINDNTMCEPDTTSAYLTGVILNISGHELRLHGHETVTIIGGDQ